MRALFYILVVGIALFSVLGAIGVLPFTKEFVYGVDIAIVITIALGLYEPRIAP